MIVSLLQKEHKLFLKLFAVQNKLLVYIETTWITLLSPELLFYKHKYFIIN